jgi:hypothetical protein
MKVSFLRLPSGKATATGYYSKVSYLRSVLDARSLNEQVAEHQRFSAL